MDFQRARVPEGEEADELVERALFLSAVGFRYTEERREKGEKSGEKVTCVRKQALPNLTAISLWLRHRKPRVWGDLEFGPEPENNLLDVLRAGMEGGIKPGGVSEVQPEAADDDDLVGP